MRRFIIAASAAAIASFAGYGSALAQGVEMYVGPPAPYYYSPGAICAIWLCAAGVRLLWIRGAGRRRVSARQVALRPLRTLEWQPLR